MKKEKVAWFRVELPDGTKVEAEGPLAEEMVRRLMGTQWYPVVVPYVQTPSLPWVTTYTVSCEG